MPSGRAKALAEQDPCHCLGCVYCFSLSPGSLVRPCCGFLEWRQRRVRHHPQGEQSHLGKEPLQGAEEQGLRSGDRRKREARLFSCLRVSGQQHSVP